MQSRLVRDRLVAQWFLILPLFHQHQLTVRLPVYEFHQSH